MNEDQAIKEIAQRFGIPRALVCVLPPDLAAVPSGVKPLTDIEHKGLEVIVAHFYDTEVVIEQVFPSTTDPLLEN